jgi:hypothetical protein
MPKLNDFIDAIKHRQHEIAESLVRGGCVNFETYQRLVGQHQGLQESLDIINSLLEEENKDVE